MGGFLNLSEATLNLTRGSLDDFAKFARSAKDDLVGEVFVLSHSGSADAMREAGKRGVKQSFLLDPEYGLKFGHKLTSMENTTTSIYGAMPAKLHAKMFHTGDRSLLMSGAFTDMTARRIEGVVMMSGNTSAAAREVTESAISGDVERMRRALRTAEQMGVVFNDGVTGERLLTKRLHQLIDTTKHELTVSTKIYTDPGIRTAVRKAAERGVNVKFTDIRGGGMHATLVIGDNQVYVGSAHLSPRAMGDMRLAFRQAREAGVFVQDAKTARALRGQLDDMKLAVYDSEQFERTRVAYDAMDAPRQVKEQIARLEGVADPALEARLVELKAKAGPAEEAWRALTTEVKAARAADGVKFKPSKEVQALLDGMGAGKGAGNPAADAGAAVGAAPAAPVVPAAVGAAPAAGADTGRRNLLIGGGVAAAITAAGVAYVATRD